MTSLQKWWSLKTIKSHDIEPHSSKIVPVFCLEGFPNQNIRRVCRIVKWLLITIWKIMENGRSATQLQRQANRGLISNNLYTEFHINSKTKQIFLFFVFNYCFILLLLSFIQGLYIHFFFFFFKAIVWYLFPSLFIWPCFIFIKYLLKIVHKNKNYDFVRYQFPMFFWGGVGTRDWTHLLHKCSGIWTTP
jgi:hypothetical protein